MRPSEFADALFTYCRLTGGSVTSYIRSDFRNQKVGGVLLSAHRFGVGADVVYDLSAKGSERGEIARRLGLRLIEESDHDHLQPLDWAAG